MADRWARLDPGQGAPTTPVGYGAGDPGGGVGTAIGQLLQELWDAQVESYQESGGFAKGLARDIGYGLGSNLTGLASLPVRALPGDVTTSANPLQQGLAPLVRLDDALWESLSPGGKAASLASAPERLLGAVPLVFLSKVGKVAKPEKTVGMGPGTIADLYRGIVRGKEKGIRTSPVEGGEFRPLHLGTRQTALERIEDVVPIYTNRDPTLTQFDLPVRGTLGTFERPLRDPGSSWVGNAETRAALQQLGVDAVLYRNSVEGAGQVSLEALADLIQKGEPSTFSRNADLLEQAVAAEREAGYQLYLPEVAKQSGRVGYSDVMEPGEAVRELGLQQHPRAMPTYTPRWEWEDVWQAAKEKVGTAKSAEPQQLSLQQFGHQQQSVPPSAPVTTAPKLPLSSETASLSKQLSDRYGAFGVDTSTNLEELADKISDGQVMPEVLAQLYRGSTLPNAHYSQNFAKFAPSGAHPSYDFETTYKHIQGMFKPGRLTAGLNSSAAAFLHDVNSVEDSPGPVAVSFLIRAGARALKTTEDGSLLKAYDDLDTDVFRLEWLNALERLPPTNIYRKLGKKYLGIK
ncbi:MAG TPA: hypothetical protein VJA25_12840 [Dehalococcoidia bacterium]|nr:hypothetical protein [Dehalococcoidia bacterium]